MHTLNNLKMDIIQIACKYDLGVSRIIETLLKVGKVGGEPNHYCYFFNIFIDVYYFVLLFVLK